MLDEYNMIVGDKQINILKCNYVVEKEDFVIWDKEELMWSREDQFLFVCYKVNNSVFVIENIGELRYRSNYRKCYVYIKFKFGNLKK